MLCAGIVASAIYNNNPYRKKGAPLVRPRDFLPGAQDEARQLTPKEILGVMREWAQTRNARA